MAATTQRTLTYDAKLGILWIADARGEKGYYLDRIHGAEGGQGFTLAKIVPPIGKDEPRSYDVLLADDGADLCDCRGHLSLAGKKPCRHVAALRCLKNRGRI